METASAPAKIILFGEHAVVYGQPAIAVPVSSLRATARFTPEPGKHGLHIQSNHLDDVLPVDIESDLLDNALAVTAKMVIQALACPPLHGKITIESTIPMASGLGSGAAVSAALARAIALASDKHLEQDALNTLIYEVEKIYHGTPSGIDNTVVVYESPVFFVRNQPIEMLKIGKPFTIIIADTGKSALTRVAVGDVRKLYESQPEQITPVLNSIGQIVLQAREAIECGQIVTLGQLMNQNHALLQQLTVSSPELDRLVQTANSAGALGAKLSGSGRGGNMIVLPPGKKIGEIEQALLDAGAAQVFVTVVQ